MLKKPINTPPRLIPILVRLVHEVMQRAGDENAFGVRHAADERDDLRGRRNDILAAKQRQYRRCHAFQITGLM